MTHRDLGRVAAIELETIGREAWPLQAFKDLLVAFAQAKPPRGVMWVAEEPKTAEILGISLRTLYNRLDTYKLEQPGKTLASGRDSV